MTEQMVNWVVGVLILLCAVGVLTMRKAVHSALCLAMTMILLAVLYVAEGAIFLAVVQVVVYTGAVMMLFLFVLMFIGVDSSESLTETIRGQRIAAITAAAGCGVALGAAIGHVTVAGVGPSASAHVGNIEGIAALLFTRYVWAFELTSVLLITAALGAMVLTHRERLGRRASQRDLAKRRFRPGGHPTTLPSSGVYALQNSVDTPALLPDGRPCELSVIRTLERGGLVLTLLAADTPETDCTDAEVLR